MSRRIRPRLADAVRRRLDRFLLLDERLERLERVERRVDELTARMAELAAGVDLKNVSERVDRGQDRLGPLEEQTSWNAHALSRLSPQLAAVEERLERTSRPLVVAGAGEDTAESHLLVDVIRDEHARVRARLSLLSSYEERIRRLEERSFARRAGDAEAAAGRPLPATIDS